jgi:hypothetical protein
VRKATAAPPQGNAEASALVAEALRLNTRYVEEVVIGWDLCPWAAHAWQHGQVERRVLIAAEPSAPDVARTIEELAGIATCAVGLLVFPRAAVGVSAWERFAEQARRTAGPFLVAPFHPDYRPSHLPASNPAQLVSLIRRTPDPTLQLVRSGLVDDLARGDRNVSDEVSRRNFESVRARDPGRLAAHIDELRQDRDRAYARLTSVGT